MRFGIIGLVGFVQGIVWARHGGTFVENKGQIYPEARFESAWGPHRVYLTPEGVALLLVDDTPFRKAHFERWGPPQVVRAHFVRIRWVGGQNTEPHGEEAEPTLYNFFQGPWRAVDVKGFHRVWYRGVYPGVDVCFRMTSTGLKWDWHVRSPEALRRIRLQYEGVSLSVKGDSLQMETSIGTFTERLPFVYLEGDSTALPARYFLEGTTVRYELLASVSGPLVIDPVVVFSSYSGSFSDNWGFTATYDLQGNAISGGNVNDNQWEWNPGGVYFPVTPGALQGTFGGGVSYGSNQPIFWATDIALWKTNPTGTVRLWATYLGGSDNEQPHSLVTDPQGNLYVLGATRSQDYPVTLGAFQPVSGGNIDIVVSWINSAGNQLLGSTYLGGSGEDGLNSRVYPLYYFYADDGRGEIVVGDTACYLISSTRSSNFPTTAGAYQTTLRGGMDAVVCMLSLDLRRLYASTYLGGSGADAGYSIRIGFGGGVYVAGGTNSSNFPTTPGSYQPSYQGGRADGWLAILSPTLSQLLISTYWGTAAYDQVFMIDLDRQGLLWGVGHTEGVLTPTPGAYGFAGRKQFVFSMNDSLSQVTRLSVWGSAGRPTPNITISAFAADRCGYVYVSGWGGLDVGTGVYGSTLGLPTTPNANQTTTDGADFYVIAFEPALSGLAYASFWGGPFSEEHVDGGTSRFDNRGVIYQSVCGGCGGNSDFPTTPGAISNTNNSPNCNNALFKIDFQLGDPVVAAAALIPSRGCVPFTMTVQNLSQNGTTYYWDFGNGQTSTAANPGPVTYTQPGTYTLLLVAENLFTCNQRDTLRRTITVDPPPSADFTWETDCNRRVTFFPRDTTPGMQYSWNFGDGQSSALPSPVHTYAAAGSYYVQLVVTSPRGCRDTFAQFVVANTSLTRADFSWTGDSCQGRYTFTNQSVGAISHVWVFSTGDTVFDFSPSYQFPASGTYQVTLVVFDSLGCSDTLRQSIQVSRSVRADFRIEIDYCALTVQFWDSSVGAGFTFWEFGDGATSSQPSPLHVYSQPGTYEVRLIVFSPDSLCSDTIFRQIEVDFSSEARAEVRVDTCGQRVIFVSRSRFANEVEWQIEGQSQRGDTIVWIAPAPGTYTWQLVTNPGGLSFCRDTLVGVVDVPRRRGLDSLRWEADLCALWIDFYVDIPSERVLRVEVGGVVYPPGTIRVRVPLSHPQVYRVEVVYIDQEGCVDTFRYALDSDLAISRALFIPNVFSPNGDGINDVFRILGSPECIQELIIYDRWGTELYSTRVAPFQWDGRTRAGERLPEGAYVYLIRFRTFSRAGTVSLLR
ncbi:MAG: PKD domain-containing protein [Bacteroidia bacterium]|nr:PKD domain-containing protein [Bacteroidia bacterium]